MKRVIITGASGFLGKALLRQMIEREIEVIAVVRSRKKLEEYKNETNLCIIECELAQIETLLEKIMDRKFDAFYHFAWEGTSGKEREDYRIQLKNVEAVCKAVAVADELKCKKFIYAGSLMEYESTTYMTKSGLIPTANYIYRTAKLTGHYMAKTIAGQKDIAFISTIISNVYGEGEYSPRFINSTLRKIINSERLAFTEATQLYDFIYISDAVNAFIHIGEFGRPYAIYYIGSKRIKPLRDYIEEMVKAVDSEQLPEFGILDYDGISLNYNEFDINKLEIDTGFQCEVPFAEGIKKTMDWLKGINNNAEI